MIKLHFTGTAGLAAGRRLVEQMTRDLDRLECWKNGLGVFALGQGCPFTEGCGVIVELPDEARVSMTIDLSGTVDLTQKLSELTPIPKPPVVDEDTQQGNGERYSLQGRRMTRCHSDDDGYCDWSGCPQLRDNEPAATGRHCPLDKHTEDD
jgi:hypothetical protein